MDAKEFTEFAKTMVDYIINYLENIRNRRVLPAVEPGYLRPLIPEKAPQTPEKWQDVMGDVERVIMKGVTHWHSPRFHAYFPMTSSFPAIVADMLSDAIAGSGFSWFASPACTELEVVMLDWLGKMIDLPAPFLASSGGKGGGIIQGSASECTLVALLGAKAKVIRNVKKQHPNWTDYEIVSKLIGYASDQCHSSVERAGLLSGVKLRTIESNDRYQMRADVLKSIIKKDKEDGLIPFFVVATLGTTNCCAFDRLDEVGPVCEEEEVWLHVDAAYAGSAFICPEYRYLMSGVEFADSFNFDPHKWMLVVFDCSALWLKNPSHLEAAFNVDPLYLQHDMQGSAPDFRHWQIPLSRRFRSLKLWFVLRLYGVENLQAHIRKQIGLAKQFEASVLSDDRFEVINEVLMGLVCFRLKGSNEMNESLLKRINDNGNVHMVPSKVQNKYFLRMAVCSRHTESHDMEYSWREVQAMATDVLAEEHCGNGYVDDIIVVGK